MAKKSKPVIGRPITEQFPSVQGGLSALATAHAPLIFFDEVSNHGYYNGIVHITLEAIRFMGIEGAPVSDRVVVAFLRMNLPALATLKQAVIKAEEQAQAAIRTAREMTTH
jgi:hypothetical protein